VPLNEQLPSYRSRCTVPSDSEVVADDTEGSQETLGMLARFEAAHEPFALTCRLV
jgi:hypothetical protein